MACLVWMNLWPKDALAKAYGVSRRTVYNCYERYFGQDKDLTE